MSIELYEDLRGITKKGAWDNLNDWIMIISVISKKKNHPDEIYDKEMYI